MNAAKLIRDITYFTPAAVVYADTMVTLIKNTARDYRAISRAIPFSEYGIFRINNFIRDRNRMCAAITKDEIVAAAERAGVSEDPVVNRLLKVIDASIAKYSERVIAG